MKKRKKRYAHSSWQGFTLLELIVALFLMALLLTMAGMGLTGYYQYSEWKQQEEYARIIYLAVQSELTKREQAGQLLELAARFGAEETLDVEKLIGEDGKPVRASVLWPNEDGAIYILEAKGSGKGDLAGDYDRYKRGALNLDDWQDQKIQILYEMIEPYVPDPAVLSQGTIRIELDPFEGLLYSCFYSSYWPEGFISRGDKMGSFFDGGEEKGDISDRTWQVRREKQIGYFGVETLSGAKSSRQKAPVIRSLKLEQEKGQLNVSWRVEAEDISAWKELTYEITVYGNCQGGEKEKISRITLNASAWEEQAPSYAGVPKKLLSLRPETGEQKIQAVVEGSGGKEWCCFGIMLDEPRYQITLVLDKGEASLSKDGSQNVRTATPADGKLALFSLYEKWQKEGGDMAPLEGVSCTVIGYGGGYGDTLMKESNREKTGYEPEETAKDEE